MKASPDWLEMIDSMRKMSTKSQCGTKIPKCVRSPDPLVTIDDTRSRRHTQSTLDAGMNSGNSAAVGSTKVRPRHTVV